jgi:hypothetical protein
MSMASNLAEIYEPFTRAQGQGRFTLPPEAVAVVRNGLPRHRAVGEGLIRDWHEVYRRISATPHNTAAVMAASDAIEKLKQQEGEMSHASKLLLQRRGKFEGEAALLLQEIATDAVQVLESLRDLRWQLMALKAERSPRAPAGPRSTADIRRALVSR